MEGESQTTSNLKFIESKRKFRIAQNSANSRSRKLITSANNHGLIIVGCDDKTIKFAQIDQFLDFSGGKDKSSVADCNQFSRTLQITFVPTLLTVARYGYSSTLLVAGLDETVGCPVIEVINLDNLESTGRLALSQHSGSEIIDYAWHPNYFEEIVALCTSRGHLLVAATQRKEKRLAIVFASERYSALTCCWSPKGKNLALGLSDGQVIRLEPTVTGEGFSFKDVDKSKLTFNHPKMTSEHQVIKLRWINKTFLVCVHAKSNNMSDPETIYSIITVKPGKPYKYWTNICFENQVSPHCTVHLLCLSNCVICTTSSSSEAALIGSDVARSGDLAGWTALIVDEEGSRIELPLDSNNRETFPRGASVTFKNINNADRPIILIYTSDGVVLAYAALTEENSFKLPEFQQHIDLPFSVQNQATSEIPTSGVDLSSSGNMFSAGGLASMGSLVPSMALASSGNLASGDNSTLGGNLNSSGNLFSGGALASLANLSSGRNLTSSPAQASSGSLTLGNQIPSGNLFSSGTLNTSDNLASGGNSATGGNSLSNKNPTPSAEPSVQNENLALPSNSVLEIKLDDDINDIKKKIAFNDEFLSLLNEVNFIRIQIEEIQDIHLLHKDAFDVIKKEIDELDLGMLENLYLIEYIKSRGSRKRTIDPLTTKKVESIKNKIKAVADKLNELDNLVDVSWEDFVRRTQKKGRRLSSLEVIYKTMATNQKIINTLKSRVPRKKPDEAQKELRPIVREIDQNKLQAFRDYLSARETVPVRRSRL